MLHREYIEGPSMRECFRTELAVIVPEDYEVCCTIMGQMETTERMIFLL